MDAFSDWIWPTLFLNEITTGMEPSISMMANRIIETERICLKLKFSMCGLFFS
jgi:hypothetical protein